LRDLGFHDVRVRHHELKQQILARIELAPAEIPALLANGKLASVAEELRKIGYAHVTLDLQGYRRGSTNEVLGKATTKRQLTAIPGSIGTGRAQKEWPWPVFL